MYLTRCTIASKEMPISNLEEPLEVFEHRVAVRCIVQCNMANLEGIIHQRCAPNK